MVILALFSLKVWIAKRIAASGYGVYAIDHPGFGLSEGLHGRPEVRGLPRFLLGQSMGGAIALKVHLKEQHLCQKQTRLKTVVELLNATNELEYKVCFGRHYSLCCNWAGKTSLAVGYDQGDSYLNGLYLLMVYTTLNYSEIVSPPRDLCDEDSVDLEDENLDGNENEIDLVSSCNGEVKLSFCICKPPEGFCIPSVDAVMKQVRE
ncbi:hypothetical protein L2E82_20100 [Cichorium intybus]|uniref:Uncharacterized protein n=1 Tax=Cichorium intybus TaxID=13427 RepID=A0ACB9DT68_CICIN|nr:hypothetical protein L2E82_20100 [Cichorium intybus]